jgi:hypothetical protein
MKPTSEKYRGKARILLPKVPLFPVEEEIL